MRTLLNEGSSPFDRCKSFWRTGNEQQLNVANKLRQATTTELRRCHPSLFDGFVFFDGGFLTSGPESLLLLLEALACSTIHFAPWGIVPGKFKVKINSPANPASA